MILTSLQERIRGADPATRRHAWDAVLLLLDGRPSEDLSGPVTEAVLAFFREKLKDADPTTPREALAALFFLDDANLEDTATLALECTNPELRSDTLFYLLSKCIKDGSQAYLRAAFCPVEVGEPSSGEEGDPKRSNIAFYMQMNPVTNREYSLFLLERPDMAKPRHWKGGHYPPKMENHPVVYVSFEDATAYCDYMSEKFGVTLKVPSEKEWELAARGKERFIYPWGNEFSGYQLRLNYKDLGLQSTTVVGSFPKGASPCGCLDMAGNVTEWTETDFDEASKILKGGSWFNSAQGARADKQYDMVPRLKTALVGFRMVWGIQRD